MGSRNFDRKRYRQRSYSSQSPRQVNQGSQGVRAPKRVKSTTVEDKEEAESWSEKQGRLRLTCSPAEIDMLHCLIDPQKLHASFDDVIIDQEVKDSVRSVLSLGSARWKGPPNSLLSQVCGQGALFYGPPGTGKTHLARAIAKDCGASMIELDAASVQSKYVSETENNIKSAFSLAAKLFPCVLFIDEVDALFYRRGDGDKSWQRSQLTQFLKEMDGLGGNAKAPMVVVATNRPEDLDEAFLRRLPRKVYFGLPDAIYRSRILEVLLKNETLDPLLDVRILARRTEGYSGSDLRNLCSEAALNWATENIIPQLGKSPSEISPNMQFGVTHFAKALKSIRPSVSQKSLHNFSEFYSRFNPRVDQRTTQNEETQLPQETGLNNPSLPPFQSGYPSMPLVSEADASEAHQFFPNMIENVQNSIRQSIRLRELPMFHSGRWQPKPGGTKGQPTAETPEDTGRLLDVPLQDGTDRKANHPLDTAKFPTWLKSMELLTPDAKGSSSMIPNIMKLMENRPENWDSVVKETLAKFGPDTQKNLQEFAENMRDMIDIGSISQEKTLDFDHKFNTGVYHQPPPSMELAICLKCRLTGHFASQCPAFQDSTNVPPNSQYGTVGQLLKLLDGDVEPLKKPRRVQFLSASGSNFKICDNCRTIPFGALFPSDEGDNDYDLINIFRDYGHLTGVFFRQDCPLCVLLVNSTPDNVVGIDSYVVIYSQLNIRRQLGAVSPKPNMPSRIMGLSLIHRPYETGSFGIWKNSALNRLNEAPEAIGLIEQPSDSGKLPYLGARLLNPDRLSVPLVGDWIERCDQKHPRTCMRIHSPELKHLRLIDVHERKLVPFPESDGCEYVALSYVWGGVSLSTYAIGDQLGPFPATLEDAVTVTKFLGKRFLWIDAVCIDQSDPADKAVQINLMDVIYSGAWLTIVALWGDNANSGLFRPSRDQLSCEIAGKTFATTFGTLQQQIHDSVWGSRAWTLQEGLLSPRCLYFSNDQLYFSCNSAGSCEAVDDTTSPYHQMDTLKKYPYFGSGEVVFRNPFVNFNPNDLEHVGGGPISVKGRLFDYGRFLKQYMCRQMSHDSDSLNAFEGVLKLLAVHLYPGGFFQGLPVEDMPMALLWQESGSPRRRPGFPAWSWAGWEMHLSKSHGLDAKRESPLRESWRQPLVTIRKSVNGKLELIHSSGPSEAGPNFSHYSFEVEDDTPDFPVPRGCLPPDQFWSLSQTVVSDPNYPEDLIRKGEEQKHLFIDCITITLRIGLEDSIDDVIIADTKCKLIWQMKEEWWENEVQNRSKTPQEFIVLARNSLELQLLLIDISEDGIMATRITTAHLRLQSLEEKMTGKKFEDMQLTLQSLYGSRNDQGSGIDGGKLAFARESWANMLLLEANCLQRRQLVLV